MQSLEPSSLDGYHLSLCAGRAMPGARRPAYRATSRSISAPTNTSYRWVGG